jgi:hypothetical protein
VPSKNAPINGLIWKDSITAGRKTLAFQWAEDRRVVEWKRIDDNEAAIQFAASFVSPSNRDLTTLLFASRFSLLIALP